jgi:Fe(3+) dicitrate transport protein
VGSSEDYIDAEHRQIMLTHLIKPTENFSIVKAIKPISRNWYKLDALKIL